MSAHNQRLLDLVRQQRMELHAGNLITDREYAELASDHGAVARLETYDQMRAELAALRQRCEDLELIVLTSESQSAWIVERTYSGQWRLKFYSDEPNKDSSVDLACDARGLPVLTDEARKALGGDE